MSAVLEAKPITAIRPRVDNGLLLCGVEGCDKPLRCKGYCNMHYKRARAHGDPSVVLKTRTVGASKLTCVVDGCDEPVRSRERCQRHYWEWFEASRPLCRVPGCTDRARSRGLCPCHYQRLRKYGAPTAGPAFHRKRGLGADPIPLAVRTAERRRVRHDPKLRAYVAILRNDPCSYCGAPSEHIDHIDPYIDGGRMEIANITAACAKCNPSKASSTLLHYLLWRR